MQRGGRNAQRGESGRLLSIEACDGVELQGYLEYAGSDRLLLHYHGLAGNFYENKFVRAFVDVAPHHSISFMSVNSRAHGLFSDAHIAASNQVLRRGAAHTKLSEIRSDLEAWLRFCRELGFRCIIVQGHSAGAVAVADFLLNGERDNGIGIEGAVFASPTDMVGLQLTTHGTTRFQEFLKLASGHVRNGLGQQLMPDEVLEGYRFDAATYLDFFTPEGPADIFNFRSPSGLQRLAEINLPLFVFFGGGAEVCSVPVDTALEELRTQLSQSLTCHIVPGAPHSYRGYEAEITASVLGWLTNRF